MASDSHGRLLSLAAALAVLAGVLLAGAGGPGQVAVAAMADPAPDPGEQFVESYAWLEGPKGYAEAQRLVKASGRAVVVYFYTDWCQYCRELERELLETPAVRGYLRGLVKVKINAEAGPAEDALAGRHGVAAYPGFFIRSPRTGAFVAVRRYVDGDGAPRLMTPEEFVQACRKAGG